MPRAEWSNIEKAEFFIPDFSVQHKAVSLLERVDKKITYTDSVLIYLKGLKTGLMQKLFIQRAFALVRSATDLAGPNFLVIFQVSLE